MRRTTRLWALTLFLPPASFASSGAQEPYFKGESCARCHAGIRDRASRPPEPPEPAPADGPGLKTYDAVVVGGGIAGLTAAYHLADRNILVLEKEERVGGKVRSESWGRNRYPVAAGYMAELYLDVVKRMFKELDIPVHAIPEPNNALRTSDDRTVFDPFGAGLGQLPEAPETQEAFRRMAEDMKAFSADPNLGGMPPVPSGARATTRVRELDGVSFQAHMLARYGPRVARFADQYAMSLFGTHADRVSALVGLVFFAADFGGGSNLNWEGGPGILSERLAAIIGESRIVTGALVVAVSHGPEGASIAYEKDGRLRFLRARKVVMATPSLVTRRIAQGLPDWKLKALSKVRYSSYVVALVGLRRAMDIGAFDLWNWSGRETVFTDLEPGDWGHPRLDAPPAGTPQQILTVFVPVGERAGRDLLLRTGDEELSRRVLEDLEKLLPETRGNVLGVRLMRWGHAMPVDYPGYLTRVRPQIAKPVDDRVFFAGVDTEMPCIEGAIVSGHRAAREVRAALGLGAPR